MRSKIGRTPNYHSRAPPRTNRSSGTSTSAWQTEEAVAASPETLSAKIDRIKKELGLSPVLGIGAALGEANAALELQPEGTLNQQADRLLALIG